MDAILKNLDAEMTRIMAALESGRDGGHNVRVLSRELCDVSKAYGIVAANREQAQREEREARLLMERAAAESKPKNTKTPAQRRVDKTPRG